MIQILLPSNFASNRFLFDLLRPVSFPLEKLSRSKIRNNCLELRNLSAWNTYMSVWIWDSRFCSCKDIPSATDITISEDLLVVSDFILLLSFCSSKQNSWIALKYKMKQKSTRNRLCRQDSSSYFLMGNFMVLNSRRKTSTIHPLGSALKVLESNYFLQSLARFYKDREEIQW